MSNCELKYKITGLPIKTAMQSFYIDNDYLYVMQLKDEVDVYISRCTISGSIAKKKDYMIIKDCGHTQTLEKYTYDGKEYFLITCIPLSKKADRTWSTCVGRVEYKSGKTIKATSIERLTDCTTFRLECALSSNGKQMCLLSKPSSGSYSFNIYDMSIVNKALDKTLASSIKSLKCVNKATVKVSTLPYGGSNQGVELTNAKSIYIIGGKIGIKPLINKFSTDGSMIKSVTMKHDDFGKGTEAESIQIKGDYLYFGVNDKTKSSYPNRIYRTSKI